MNIEWEEPPEQQRGRNSMYADFAIELRKHPKRWAKYPTEFKSAMNASQSASNQKRDAMVSLPKDEFETVARGVHLYVRYIGDGAA